MPFTYDIKNDIRHQQGRNEEKKQTIISLLENEFTAEKVAKILNISLDLVKEIAKGLKK